MSKYTARPWHTSGGQIYPEETGKTIALIAYFDAENKGDKANARLIAASPELLEALKGLHGALSRMIDKHDPDSLEAEWLQHSHEAISKAENS